MMNEETDRLLELGESKQNCLASALQCSTWCAGSAIALTGMAEGRPEPGERHREEARDAAQSARQQLGKSQEAAEESLSRAGQSMRDQAAWAKAKAADAVERGQQAAEESISRAGQAARDHSTRARASGSSSLEQGQQAAEQRLNSTGRPYAMRPLSLLLL